MSRTRSFREAADQLGMTLSALSMQMKSLEEVLGVVLFDRSVRPPRLTPIGRQVVAEAALLLRHEDNLIDISRSGEALVGRFRIGFVTTAAVRMLPGFLLAAKDAAPRATFEFETGLSAVLQDRVAAGQLDAAVITDADGLPAGLASILLRRDPFVFAARAELLSDGLSGLLAQNVFFHFMPATGIGKLIATAMLGHERAAGAKTIVLDNLEAIMECVSAGSGFTLLPAPDVARYRTADVKTIAAAPSLQRKLVLVTARDGVLARRSEALSALLGSG